jgi:4-amino-4-deoxy-L-arabinose transferase-like glycosyltransferase
VIAPRSTPHAPRHWQWIAVLLLCLLFVQTAGSAVRTSLTTDEGLHITSGYSILRTGDYRLIEEHPPLIKMLATLPLLSVHDLADPRTLPDWEQQPGVSDTVQLVRVMKHWLQPYRPFDRVVFAARVPIMLLSLLLGAIVFRWASDLAGPWAGLMALGLYAFDPNIVAHSSVAAIDLGAAALITFASYAFWRALRRPSRVNVALAGVTLGLAQVAKISALLLLPLFVVLAGVRALTIKDPVWPSHLQIRGPTLARIGVLLIVMFVLAGATVWAVYGFEVRTPPGWSIPMPASSHLIPLERVRADLSAGRTTFLMGQYSEHGWWYYFPVAFALKTPLPTLILLFAAIIIFVRKLVRTPGGPRVQSRPKQFADWDAMALVAFPLLYFASALVQPFNIGYRHLLPILPFLFVFIGVQVAGRKMQTVSSKIISLFPRLIVPALFAWCAIGTVQVFPDYLAYFNELAGGPDGGYRYLVDSNLDWGQAWKELKAYMDAHGITRIKLAQFSSNDPATYGIDYEPIAPMAGAPPVLPSRFNPAPGVYVLSASSLQGVPLADVNTYDYFRHQTPTARVGHAMFVYDINPLDPKPGWVAQCAAPAPPLEPADVAAGFGRNDLRLVYFDCQQTWVMPGNSASGWVVVPFALAHDPAAFALSWLSHGRLIVEQRQSFDLPPHSIIEFQTPALNSQNGMRALAAPTTIGDTAELLGYALDRATVRRGQSVELLTFWRVIGRPPGNLSVMAHLRAADGRTIAIGDGLGFTAEQWQAGDVFVQRHHLSIPLDALPGPVTAQTGLYSLDNLQRLSVSQNGSIIGDSLPLTSLRVEP